MDNDRRYDQLCEASWRRPLTASEEAELRAWLAEHPASQADWETELALSDALRRLPEPPVATNFTSRVLQAVQAQSSETVRPTVSLWQRWHRHLRWLPKVAVAGVVLVAGLFSYHRVADVRRVEKWARPLELVSGVAVPNTEILENFDAIEALNRTPAPNAGPDEELLQLLQ